MADRSGFFWLGLIAAGLLFASGAKAAGTAGADFLSIPVGGRAAAMGGAYSALAEDAFAPVWNPAGLAGLSSPQLGATHLSYPSSLSYEFLGAAAPLGASAGIGISAQYLHSGAIAGRDAAGADIGSFNSSYGAYSLGLARTVMPGLSVGAAGKVVTARIADVSGRAFGADAGLLYHANERVSLAAVAANIGTKLTLLQDGQRLPQTYRAGAAFSPISRLTLAAEAGASPSDGGFGRLGAEWRPLPLVSVRGGYHSDGAADVPGLTGVTAGFGLLLLGQRFDYAWAPMGDLGDTHYFSVLLSLGSGSKK